MTEWSVFENWFHNYACKGEQVEPLASSHSTGKSQDHITAKKL